MTRLFAQCTFAFIALASPWVRANDAPLHKSPRVILVGDSTMASNSGYGDALCSRMRADVSCINLARGGRSTGSFRAESRWDTVQLLLREGEQFSRTYVLIQFGHNDQPGKPGRSTDLVTQYPANLARYAAEVTALGGVPVLVTPLTRRTFKGAYLHDDLAPWAAATRAVARTHKVALLDLHALSAKAVQAMGQDQADTLAQAPKPAATPAIAGSAAVEPQGAPKSTFDRTHVGVKGSALFSAMVAGELKRLFPALAPAILSVAHGPADTQLSPVPQPLGMQADGWAGQEGGTRGGADASSGNIVTVTDPASLRKALTPGAHGSRIIRIAGVIDMAEGQPFSSNADQASRGTLKLPSNTTLIGIGQDAGLVNASVRIANASQVIIRNLHFRNPCDVAPQWDPSDGARGNWNAQFDSITVSGSHHVWIDHNSFTDAPFTDDTLARENGKPRQCHDGALDINSGADLVTVSYNRFALHEKNMLIGSSDNATGDAGRLRVTIANNWFAHVSTRAPRVRFGQVHMFNNYHVGDRRHPVYAHQYSVGVGKQARLVSHQNVFDIDGARRCGDVVRRFDNGESGASFVDTGSLLNGALLAPCDVSDAGWIVPYAFSARPAAMVKDHVTANAGAGKLAPPPGCPNRDFHFCTTAKADDSSVWLRVSDSLVTVTTNQPAQRNFFVEARMRPSPDSGAGSRQLYVIGPYTDPRNWIGAGLDLASGSTSTQIQLVKMRDGVLSQLKQVARARAPADRFSTVRLEKSADMLTVYLNGEKITSAVHPDVRDMRAHLGLYSMGPAFEISEVRHGQPDVQPARVAPALGDGRFTAQAGDAPAFLAVCAIGSDGVTRLPITASSSNRAVLAVSAGANGVALTPRAPGVASVIITSTVDPSVQTIVDANVTAPLALPVQRYRLATAVTPAVGAQAVPPDTLLRLDFDRQPTLGTSGAVRIFRKADDALVDTIRTGEEVAAIGFPGQPRSRYVRHTPITITGKVATIKPHGHSLGYGDAYYVTIDAGVFQDTAIAGVPFKGIGKRAAWSFRTSATAPAGTALIVDDDGPADFRTVQGALNHAMSKFDKATPVTIDVRNGRYPELLFILAKDQLTIRGQSRDGVIIYAANSDGINPGSGLSQAALAPSFSGGRSVLMVEESDLFTVDTLTLRNTTLRSGTRSGQAETLYFNNDFGRLIAKNASFFSEQDTIQVKGYAWFYRTLIAGNVDFIWGANRAAVFEESEIRSVGDSANPDSGGYVVQARTVTADDPGFVFLNSALTHGAGPAGNDVSTGTTYLARSPGTASTWDNVSFVNCKMDRHVAAIGWASAGVGREPAPNPARANAMHGWREFGSTDLTGKKLDLSARSGGHLLSGAEVQARFANRATIFARFNGGQGWNPVP